MLSLFVSIHGGCAALTTPQNSTLLGTAGGSVLGAQLGKRSGHPVSGTILGALGGGLIGHAVGTSIQNRAAWRSGMPPIAPANQPGGANQRSGMTVDQVIHLSKNGVSRDLITNQIKSVGFAGPLETDDLINLKKNGVDESVIRQLQLQPRTAPRLPQGFYRRKFAPSCQTQHCQGIEPSCPPYNDGISFNVDF